MEYTSKNTPPVKYRWFFSLVFLFLCAQFLFVHFVDEYYPAIKFPSFTNLFLPNNQVEGSISEVIIESKDGKIYPSEPRDLFKALPKAFVGFALRTIEERSNLRLEYAQPASSQDVEMLKAFKSWLVEEIESNLGIQDPVKATFNYYQLRLTVPSNPLQEEKKFLRSTVLKLEGL